MKSTNDIFEEKKAEEKAISDVISGIAFAFEQQDAEMEKDDIEKVCKYYESFNDDDYYATTMFLICNRFNEVPAKPWLYKHPYVEGWDSFIIKSIFNGLFSHWLYTMIDIYESKMGGQGDKHTFITKKVIKSIADEKNISLYAEYKDKPGEQAFWSPKHFKDTNQVKVEFVSWWEGKDMKKYVLKEN